MTSSSHRSTLFVVFSGCISESNLALVDMIFDILTKVGMGYKAKKRDLGN